MKTLLKILTAAAAFGLVPLAASAQTVAPAEKAAAAPTDPAQPADVSNPAVANITGEAPSDALVAQSTKASDATPTPGIGQPDGRMGLQDQVTPIGREAAWFHDVLLMPIITAISVFVLGLLLWVCFRFR